jgi:hypothetical protein
MSKRNQTSNAPKAQTATAGTPDGQGVLDTAHQGSNDVKEIRDQAAQILEGGRAVFSQR